MNHANAGIYDLAVDQYLAGSNTTPEITAHPLQTTVKYGFGLNIEQPLEEWLGALARWRWNEQHESFAHTEVDQTWQVGVGANGTRWRRRYGRVGLVFVSNAIGHPYRLYLAYGGDGFLLGDGRLTYGPREIPGKLLHRAFV